MASITGAVAHIAPSATSLCGSKSRSSVGRTHLSSVSVRSCSLTSSSQDLLTVRVGAGRRNNQRSISCQASIPDFKAPSALTPELKETIDNFLASHKLVLFIKGNRQFPQCGFSDGAVKVANALDKPYETVDILADETLRQAMKEYSQWPTFPQVYLGGEFVGGFDIFYEALSTKEFQEQVEVVFAS
eukprot:jgi/Mesen1/6838/ME000351S05957